MLEKLQNVIRDYKGDDSLVITNATTFAELALDSLEIVEFVMNLEDELGVTIEMNENIKSVGDLIAELEK